MSASFNNAHIRNLLESWPEMAIVLLYDNFYDQLLRIADIHTQERQSSEDVLQEVFAEVFKRHKEIAQKRDEPILRYMIKAVQFHSISHYRHRVSVSARETQYFYSQIDPEGDYSADRNIISHERKRFLRLIVGTLPPREKECFLMQLDGMRVKDIARRLSISVKAVEANLTSARKRLRAFSGVEI